MPMQNFILIAGAETRRTFAKGDEKKYPGIAPVQPGLFMENGHNNAKL